MRWFSRWLSLSRRRRDLAEALFGLLSLLSLFPFSPPRSQLGKEGPFPSNNGRTVGRRRRQERDTGDRPPDGLGWGWKEPTPRLNGLGGVFWSGLPLALLSALGVASVRTKRK